MDLEIWNKFWKIQGWTQSFIQNIYNVHKSSIPPLEAQHKSLTTRLEASLQTSHNNRRGKWWVNKNRKALYKGFILGRVYSLQDLWLCFRIFNIRATWPEKKRSTQAKLHWLKVTVFSNFVNFIHNHRCTRI